SDVCSSDLIPLFLSNSDCGSGNTKCLLTSNCSGEDRLVLKPDCPPSQFARLISPATCHRFRSHHLWPSPASSTKRSSMIHCIIVSGLVSDANRFAGPSPIPSACAQFLALVRTSLIWSIAAAELPVLR